MATMKKPAAAEPPPAAPMPAEPIGAVHLNPPVHAGDNASLYPPLDAAGKEVDGQAYPEPDMTVPLISLPDVTMCQIHPRYGPGSFLARGQLQAWNAQPGDPLGASLIIQVGGIRAFLTEQDCASLISQRDLMLMLPQDVLGLNFPYDMPPQLKELLRARCGIREELEAGKLDPTMFSEEARPSVEKAAQIDAEQLAEDFSDIKMERTPTRALDPEAAARRKAMEDDRNAAKILKMSAWLSNKIVDSSDAAASKVDNYGERKTSSVQPTGKDASGSVVRASSVSRSATGKASKVMKKVASKVSDTVGSKAGGSFAPKETDSERKRRMRLIAAASLEAYNDVTDALADGYTVVLESTQKQSSGYAEKKYGPNAAQAMENTVASGYHAGNTALNARRVVSVSHHASKTAKTAAKNTVYDATGIPHKK
mmetsp:Transcript_3767/g.8303  ORF Transcript_3767/g.8303 Transcript_3767/m.8303 type:complete len:425 (-) Transcript_3767:152-1426(-)